jgi:hypothetical protein
MHACAHACTAGSCARESDDGQLVDLLDELVRNHQQVDTRLHRLVCWGHQWHMLGCTCLLESMEMELAVQNIKSSQRRLLLGTKHTQTQMYSAHVVSRTGSCG